MLFVLEQFVDPRNAVPCEHNILDVVPREGTLRTWFMDAIYLF